MTTYPARRDPRKWARSLSCRRDAQRGATAIEFALVFPIFFSIFYVIVTFSMIFVAQQSLTLASAEGARAALNYQSASSVSGAVSLRATAACNTATNMVAPMIQRAACQTAQATCNYDSTMTCIAVTLTYNYAASPLIPTLPGLGLLLPQNLSSTATVQLNPVNIL